MSSLAGLLLSQLGGSEIQQMSRSLGSDPDRTGAAVKAAIPMLMAALARNAESDAGRSALDQALARDHDGSVLDGIGDFVARGSREDGDAILRHVLGSRRPEAEAGLGRASGLDPQQAGGVLAMVAPLVLGALGRRRGQGGMDAAALAGLLSGERDQARDTLGGLAGFLDRDGDGQVADDVLGGLARGLKGRLFGG